MEELEWKDSLLRILEKDSRYDAHAYIFMNNAVSYTVNKLSKQGRPLGTRHVSGAQLIQGMLEYAVSTYMFLAPDMLRYWNLLSGRDAGNIVYNLIEEGVLSAGPNDRIEEHRGLRLRARPDLRHAGDRAAQFREPSRARVRSRSASGHRRLIRAAALP